MKDESDQNDAETEFLLYAVYLPATSGSKLDCVWGIESGTTIETLAKMVINTREVPVEAHQTGKFLQFNNLWFSGEDLLNRVNTEDWVIAEMFCDQPVCAATGRVSFAN